MKKVKVNIDKIPEEYRPLVKEEMTADEVAMLGNIILKMQGKKIKNKFRGLFRARKVKDKD